MFSRTTWWRGLGLATIAVVGLSACEGDTTEVIIPDPLTISASPAQLNMVVGQTQQIVASVQGGPAGTDRAVTYTSSATGVASVNAQGVVTAVAPGVATITVASVADPNVRVGVGVNVTAAEIPPTEGDAQISIQAITQGGTLFPVDPDNTFGQIDVILNFERGPATSLVVLLNGVVVDACTQTFGSANEPAAITAEGLSIAAQSDNIVCSINTARYDVDLDNLMANIWYPNDDYVVRAELRQNGDVLDSAQRSALSFRNVDFVDSYVSSEGHEGFTSPVIGSGGFQWHAGDIEFRLIPVIYSAGPGLSTTASGYPAQATLSLTGEVMGVSQTTTRNVTTLTGGGFLVVFPGDWVTAFANGTVHRFNTGQAGSFITASTVTVGGQPGPSSDPNPALNRFRFVDLQSGTAIPNSILRVDNEAPDAGTLVLTAHPIAGVSRNGWVNAAYSFAGGKAGQNDMPFNLLGVGLASPAFQIYALHNPSATVTAAAVVDNGFAITTGADLEQTLHNSEYAVAARVWDILGNRSNVLLSRPLVNPLTGETEEGTANRIGADFTIPELARINTPQQYNPQLAAAPADQFTVRATDAGFGFSGPGAIRITPFRFAAECDSTVVTAEVDTNIYPVQGGVTPIDMTKFASDLAGVEAYYRMNSVGWDRAGNMTPTVYTDRFIIDVTNPFVSNVTVPPVPLFVGGQLYDFVATATDGVDLRGGQFGFDFDAHPTLGDFALPVRPFTISPFACPIVPQTLISEQMRFVRQLETVDGAGEPANDLDQPDWVRVRVWDHADLNAGDNLGRSSTQRNNLVDPTKPALGPSLGSATHPDTRRIRQAEFSADTLAGGTTFRVRGVTGVFVSPFVEVILMQEVTDVSGATYLRIIEVRSGTQPSDISDTGTGPTGRTFTYRFDAAVPSGADVCVAGITGQGDALLVCDTAPTP